MWCFKHWVDVFFPGKGYSWWHAGARKEGAEKWKHRQKEHCFLHEGFYFEEKQEKQKVCHRPRWVNFVCSFQRGMKLKAQQTRSALWPHGKDTHVGSCTSASFLVIYPFPFDLLPSSLSTGYPWDRGDNLTLSVVPNLSSFCYAGTAKRHSCWHFLKPHLTGIHHLQLSASSLTSSFSSHRAAASDCRIFAFEGSLGWTASFWLSGNTK